MGRAPGLLLLLPLLAASSVARAEVPARGDLELSRRLYLAGQRAFEAERYDEAAELFEKAWDESPRPALLWNAASAHRKQYERGHDVAQLRRAREECERYRALAPNERERQEAVTLLGILDAELAHAEAKPSEPRTLLLADAPAGSRSGNDHARRSHAWIGGVVAGAAVVVGGAVTLGLLLGSGGPEVPLTNGGNFLPAFH